MPAHSSPSLIRTAHGNGGDALLRAETPPLDEIPAPNAEDTERGLAVRAARGRPFTAGNAAAKGRRPKLARAGLDVPTADARWQALERQGRRYAQRRCRELAVMCGGSLGAGPCSMLASAGLALAASRYAYAVGAETGDVDLLRKGATLADSARGQELTAVALAEREREAFTETDEDRVRRERTEYARSFTVGSSPDHPPSPSREAGQA